MVAAEKATVLGSYPSLALLFTDLAYDKDKKDRQAVAGKDG